MHFRSTLWGQGINQAWPSATLSDNKITKLRRRCMELFDILKQLENTPSAIISTD
jgi:hypothetical protein